MSLPVACHVPSHGRGETSFELEVSHVRRATDHHREMKDDSRRFSETLVHCRSKLRNEWAPMTTWSVGRLGRAGHSACRSGIFAAQDRGRIVKGSPIRG